MSGCPFCGAVEIAREDSCEYPWINYECGMLVINGKPFGAKTQVCSEAQLAAQAAEIAKLKELLDLERLSALEHEQWAHWTEYFLDNLTPENIARWRQQIVTPYEQLLEIEKEADRKWARKILNRPEVAALGQKEEKN